MQSTITMKKKHVSFSTERLKLIRESKGMNTDEFGAAIGKTGRSVYNWECGRTSPTMRDLERIATVFDLDLTFFLKA
jgi:transcriptional regulator with XRE-family HTH domain